MGGWGGGGRIESVRIKRVEFRENEVSVSSGCPYQVGVCSVGRWRVPPLFLVKAQVTSQLGKIFLQCEGFDI